MEKVLCSVTGEPAKYAFEWSWGEKGFCSEAGKGQLQQLAVNLSQQCSFAPLVTNEVLPVGRDERAQLLGKIQALTFELEEAEKARAESAALIDRLQNETRGLRIANDRWKELGEKSEKEVSRLKDRVVELEAEERRLVAAVEDYRDAVGADDVGRLTGELQAAKEEIARLEATIARLDPEPEPVPPTL